MAAAQSLTRSVVTPPSLAAGSRSGAKARTTTAPAAPALRSSFVRSLCTPKVLASKAYLGSQSLLSLSQAAASSRAWERQTGGALTCRAVATEAPAKEEKHEYQAEVSRLLDLIVHSLYSHKEVFLRELVSNASDALDKLRFLSVTDQSLLGDFPDLEIRIKADKDAGTITITDSGIGMTREELLDSLGTIARSGTAKFVQAIKDNKDDNNLIGQFGVGFYSAFLVADKITVTTKSPKSDQQWIWESEADTSTYTIKEEMDDSKLLPRGTSITLHLKEADREEYLDFRRINGLVKNYSQFISFPIYTWVEELVDKEVPDTDAPVEEGQEPKMKTISEKKWEWKLQNETKPLWMRSPKDVEKKDYDEFFKSTFKEFMEPAAYSHFKTEGEIEFTSLLFVPGMPPFTQEEAMPTIAKNIRLYVKRVFISDDFGGDLMPRYLAFVKGVVDSNDLPLNVSRELLQESRVVRIMRKRLIRKTFDMMDEIAKDGEKYDTFWQNWARNIKLGVIEDSANHNRLAPLLRFFTSKSEDKQIGLQEYIDRMKPDQKDLYYLAADSKKSAQTAPFLEQVNEKGFEVLFLTEAIDEVAVNALKEFKDKKLVDITKEDLDLGDASEKEEMEKAEKEYVVLCDYLKRQLGDKVAQVKISNRISTSPCVLVTSKFGWSANMEKVMKAQAMGADPQQMEYMRGRKILEINPKHPIIKDLDTIAKTSPTNVHGKNMVELLYESSLLTSGFQPDNPTEFVSKVYEMMAVALDAKRKQRQEDLEKFGSPKAPEQPKATPAAEESTNENVVEASQVLTEEDPWKQ
ncbi:molecular chaperone HtpG [Klebsormidium nitens]|uniref:Molecular chaperone HtpG n=1 Tax=Klebsormidium nitens TaxID=105231 RepID=A0A1Y1HL34_KLENI|nr:molecular chaperone HtpG [Klebsormidium nitens]|eukprot:GAQ77691.1 molecular chaperone HtpG [Klebsormidium nitens]